MFILTALLFMISCKTTTTLTSKLTLGMTKEQVIAKCGRPYKTSAKYDKEMNLQEILYYKEKTWDDGGFSWSTTVTNHLLVFKNNILVAIEQGDEEHNKQTYNTMFVF
jgi:outer membrane protein assembly factor BamE (lipoprotein component of BamABCDE complex)